MISQIKALEKAIDELIKWERYNAHITIPPIVKNRLRIVLKLIEKNPEIPDEEYDKLNPKEKIDPSHNVLLRIKHNQEKLKTGTKELKEILAIESRKDLPGERYESKIPLPTKSSSTLKETAKSNEPKLAKNKYRCAICNKDVPITKRTQHKKKCAK